MIKARLLLSVVVVTILSLSARTGYAAMQCVANAAVPPTVRSEGLAENMGDLVLDCTGGVAGTPVLAGFTFFINSAATGRIVTLPATAEALLIVDEPAAAVQALNVNIFQGQLSGPNSFSWTNIPLTEPGLLGHRIIRITNVRADGGGLPGSPSVFQGLISVTGGGLLVSNPVQVLAFGMKGLNFSASNTAFDRSLAPGTSGNPSQFTITFSEAFPTVFKKRILGPFQNITGQIYNTESGFTSSASGAAGLADTGTRLVASFSNVPSGVSLSVPTTVTVGPFSAVLMTGTAPDLSGGSPAVTGDIALSGGSGIAVWEVTDANPLAAETISIPVTVSYIPGILSGTALVTGSLGPAGSGATASATAPLPRFTASPVALAAFHFPTAVPTMGEWGMLVFMALAGLGSLRYLRRSAQTGEDPPL